MYVKMIFNPSSHEDILSEQYQFFTLEDNIKRHFEGLDKYLEMNVRKK